jgi:hypothetical protein
VWERVRDVVRRLALRVRARRRPRATVIDWTAPGPPEHWAARVRAVAPELLDRPVEAPAAPPRTSEPASPWAPPTGRPEANGRVPRADGVRRPVPAPEVVARPAGGRPLASRRIATIVRRAVPRVRRRAAPAPRAVAIPPRRAVPPAPSRPATTSAPAAPPTATRIVAPPHERPAVVPPPVTPRVAVPAHEPPAIPARLAAPPVRAIAGAPRPAAPWPDLAAPPRAAIAQRAPLVAAPLPPAAAPAAADDVDPWPALPDEPYAPAPAADVRAWQRLRQLDDEQRRL